VPTSGKPPHVAERLCKDAVRLITALPLLRCPESWWEFEGAGGSVGEFGGRWVGVGP